MIILDIVALIISIVIDIVVLCIRLPLLLIEIVFAILGTGCMGFAMFALLILVLLLF